MSQFSTLLDSFNRASVPWGHAMLRASLDAAVGIAFVWLVFRLFRRTPPRLQCWVWRAVYFKLILSLVWAGRISLPVLSARTIVKVDGLARVESPTGAIPATAEPLPLPPMVWPVSQAADPTARRASPHPSMGFPALLLLIWAIGAAVGGAQIGKAWCWAWRLRKQAVSVSDPMVLSVMRAVCQSAPIGHPPELLASSKIDSPLLVGVLRPAIVVPADLVGRISAAQLRIVLAHELAHLRRHDLLWGWLPAIVNTVFFFHPCLWLAQRELTFAREVACDESAVSDSNTCAADYLSVLLTIASGRTDISRPSCAAASIVESYKTLQRRFIAMRSILSLHQRHRVIVGAAVGAITVVGILPWRPTMRQAAACDARPQTLSDTSRAPTTTDQNQNTVPAGGVAVDRYGGNDQPSQYHGANLPVVRGDPTAGTEVQRLARELAAIQDELAQTRQRLLELQRVRYQAQLDRHTVARPNPYDATQTPPSSFLDRGDPMSHASDIRYSAVPGPQFSGSHAPQDEPSGPNQRKLSGASDRHEQLQALERDVHRILDEIDQMKAADR